MNTNDLCLALNICNVQSSKILKIINEIKEVHISSYEEILKVISSNVDMNILYKVRSVIEDDLIKIKDRLHNDGISFVTTETTDYPHRLRTIPDPPAILYYKGEACFESKDDITIAIVGARGCSEYGKSIAYSLSKELSLTGITIISGMAVGIDKQAHLGALDTGGKTLAILGSGVNICYPRENITIYEKIKDTGAIISEYPPDTPPSPYNFPRRNRLISGLADILILIEAKEKSGSLITVDQALEQNKDVYVVPGRITDPLSIGCNRLIKQGAGIITDIPSFLSEILSDKVTKRSPLSSLTKKERSIYDLIDTTPVSLEDIYQKAINTDMDLGNILITLWSLQEKNLVRESSKNYYVRCI